MDVKLIFLLVIIQGFHLGLVCWGQKTGYSVTALLGSCVELPCTQRSSYTSDKSGVVWFYGNEEILNTKDSSSLLEKYRNRTSLVPGGKSCTLRIDPVRRGDGNKNYYSRNYPYSPFLRSGAISLSVTDYPEGLRLSVSKDLTEGKATTIQCTADHTCRSSPPTIRWNKPGRVTKKSVKISEGSWREESELTYIPSYVDDGSRIQCTATYPNGQTTERSADLKIFFAPKHVTVTIIEKGEIPEGSDVNLVCISISKPEVNMYEWYKGRNRTLLPYTGWKMTVRNVTRDVEPYSCTAINTVGRGESALTEIPLQYEVSNYYFTESNCNCNVILLATIGTVGPLLLLLVVYVYWRKRCRKVTSSEAAESPDETCSDLKKKDIAIDYEEMKPVTPKHIAMGHAGASNPQEKTHKKSAKNF